MAQRGSVIVAMGGAAPDPGEESFLACLSSEEARELRSRGVTRSFLSGAALFHERQVSDKVVVLLSGRVKLSCTTDDGKEVLLAIRGPGDLLGELSAIDGEPRSAAGTAIEPVEALTVAATDFTSFIGRNPRVALLILRMLSGRLRDADRKRVEFAAQDAVSRVAGRLVELCERFGEQGERGIRINLPISQEELAGWAGASREAVSKALKTLRELGWIETHRRSLTVLDLEALRRRAF